MGLTTVCISMFLVLVLPQTVSDEWHVCEYSHDSICYGVGLANVCTPESYGPWPLGRWHHSVLQGGQAANNLATMAEAYPMFCASDGLDTGPCQPTDERNKSFVHRQFAIRGSNGMEIVERLHRNNRGSGIGRTADALSGHRHLVA